MPSKLFKAVNCWKTTVGPNELRTAKLVYRLIKDSKGETKPFGMQFLHQNINGGKTANGIAKEVGNFNVVALLNQYRLKDPGIDEDDIDKIVTRHWCCSNKNFERVKRAACDF